MSPRSFLAPVIFALGAALAVACGASSESSDGSGAGGFGGDSATSSGGGSTGGAGGGYNVDVGGQPNIESPSYAALCGEGECVPGGRASDCALGGDPGVGGAGGQGGAGGGQVLFCQVIDDRGEPASACGVVGVSEAQGPCTSSADCGAGLGCVKAEGSLQAGQCFPYCCGDLEACPESTHCVPRTMFESELEIPVCEPVVPCELLNEDSCPAGEACAVVRADGTTSCTAGFGDGLQCDDCPCAPGFVCSKLTQTCQKICHTDASNEGECGEGTCQGGSASMPEGFGICVGGAAECSS